MKYIVCEKPGEFLLKEKEIPVKKKNEALLKINKVGICGTDLHAYAGNQAFFSYPRILGHELAATVLEIEENERGIKVGDNVVIMPYLSCGKCIACRNGKTNCCTNIEVLGVHTDGGMQEMIAVPTNILLPANNLSDDPNYMAHGGRFVLVGLSKGELTYTHPAIHAKEMTLMCSRNATLEDFEHVISVLDQFPTKSFITHTVPYNEMISNFDSWLDPKNGVIKATVTF